MSQQATSERMLGIGLLASLIAGLIAGISARIIMRIVALTAHMPPDFSIAGTLNVVFIGFILGFVSGFIYTGCVVALSSSTKASKYLPGPLWRGIAFGVLLLVIGGLPSVLIPLLPKEDLNLGIPLLNRSMFAALTLIYGITLGGAEAILDRYLPRKPASPEGDQVRSSPQLNEE
jgi:uncharacterized membrane protein YagU involved in acid resistance